MRPTYGACAVNESNASGAGPQYEPPQLVVLGDFRALTLHAFGHGHGHGHGHGFGHDHGLGHGNGFSPTGPFTNTSA